MSMSSSRSNSKSVKVSERDREVVRDEILSIARRLRDANKMTVPDVRSFLHEMVDLSV